MTITKYCLPVDILLACKDQNWFSDDSDKEVKYRSIGIGIFYTYTWNCDSGELKFLEGVFCAISWEVLE